ncbi:MAG: hypothetical protein HY000_28050, partial [Planctomycetes bacterium]|nr:hypothetical protein [Planctomycetota bacterium]
MEYWGSPPSGVPSKPFGRSYSPMNRFVSAISGTNNYTYFRGGGEVFHFIKQGDGSYDVDVPGVWGFTKNGNNTFTLTLDGGDREEYDTAGKLTGIVDSDGNSWSFSYGTVGSYSNALTKMTEPDSDTFELTYDSTTARVTKVYANGPGTTWELYYDGSDNMTKLTVVDCQSCGSCGTRTFTYSSGSGDPPLNNNLTSVKNADAVEKQAFSYSSADQAT